MKGETGDSLPAGIIEGTDAANVYLLTQTNFADQARYIHGLGWYTYQAGSWTSDPSLTRLEHMAAALLRGTVYQLVQRAQQGGQNTKGLDGWARSVGNRTTVLNAIRHAAGGAPYFTEASQWDADPHLLNCRNGVLNLLTGKLLAHSPTHLMTLQAAADFDPVATHQRVEQLVAVLRAEGVDDFLQRFFGSVLYGKALNEIIVVLKGAGGIGKSTLISVLQRCLGTYASTIDVNLLMEKSWTDSGTGPKPELLNLRGRRLVTAGEPSAKSQFDVARVKTWTGGDSISARRMRSDDVVSFVAQFKLLLHTNHTVVFPHDDSGMARRFRQVELTLRPGQPDPDFKSELLEEQSALNAFFFWMYLGFRLWYDEKYSLGDDARVRETTTRSLESMDPYFQFSQTHLGFGADLTLTVKRLNTLLDGWCEARGHDAGPRPTRQGLRRFLLDRGCTDGRKAQSRYWQGVGEV